MPAPSGDSSSVRCKEHGTGRCWMTSPMALISEYAKLACGIAFDRVSQIFGYSGGWLSNSGAIFSKNSKGSISMIVVSEPNKSTTSPSTDTCQCSIGGCLRRNFFKRFEIICPPYVMSNSGRIFSCSSLFIEQSRGSIFRIGIPGMVRLLIFSVNHAKCLYSILVYFLSNR